MGHLSQTKYIFLLVFLASALGNNKCPTVNDSPYVAKSFTKACAGKFNYCIPNKDSIPWDCPRSLVFNPEWNGCDSRKACKRKVEEGEDSCLGRPCGLYPGDQCNLYHVCSGGTKFFKKCSGTFIYDYIKKECGDPEKGAKCKESLVRRPIVPTDIAPPEAQVVEEPCTYHGNPPSEGKRSKENDGLVLTSPKLTDYGEWKGWAMCPNGSYFTGVQVWKRSTQADDGTFDHAGVVSLGFKCENPLDREKEKPLTEIGQCANGAPDNEWGTFLECKKGVGVSLQLSQLAEQGKKKDDHGTDNVKMYCSCGQNKELFKPYHKPLKKYTAVGGQPGDWTAPMNCPTKQALCGFRTQMQDWVKEIIVKLEESDMTAMNQVKVKCCDVQSPGYCTPAQSKIFIQTCDNSDAEVTRPCPFNVTVGILVNLQKWEKASQFYDSIGHDLKETLPILQQSIDKGIEPCNANDPGCEQNWKVVNDLNSRMYREAQKEMNQIDVKPGLTIKIHQTIINCGIYRMFTNQLVRELVGELTTNEVITF